MKVYQVLPKQVPVKMEVTHSLIFTKKQEMCEMPVYVDACIDCSLLPLTSLLHRLCSKGRTVIDS